MISIDGVQQDVARVACWITYSELSRSEPHSSAHATSCRSPLTLQLAKPNPSQCIAVRSRYLCRRRLPSGLSVSVGQFSKPFKHNEAHVRRQSPTRQALSLKDRLERSGRYHAKSILTCQVPAPAQRLPGFATSIIKFHGLGTTCACPSSSWAHTSRCQIRMVTVSYAPSRL